MFEMTNVYIESTYIISEAEKHQLLLQQMHARQNLFTQELEIDWKKEKKKNINSTGKKRIKKFLIIVHVLALFLTVSHIH